MANSCPSITILVARKQAFRLQLQCKVAGEITEKDCANIAPMCSVLLAQNQCYDLLLDISQFQHCSVKLLCNKLKLAAQYRDAFAHVAIFGNSAWQMTIASLINRMGLSGIRYFEYRADALSWLDAS